MARRPKKTREELLRIWQKVDKNNDGFVGVEDIVSASKVLEAECPEFIHNFETIQKGGKVKRQDFLDLCMGKEKRDSAGDAVKREVDIATLKALFDEIATKGSPPQLQLADLIAHKARIRSVFPDLIDRFTEADLNKDCMLSWDEVQVFAAGTEDWLEYQFDRIIGLGVLKDQLRQFYRSVTLDQKRRESGHDVKTGGKYHMIFQGNPGTGKTTVARLVAQLLSRIGIIKSDLLIEVQRDKLVAEYVGQTGPKTQKVIEDLKLGVLFIDEAYRLSQNGGKSDFGKEAIEQLMGAMNEPPGQAPVMVFAGYPDDMDEFMRANSGLYRRIAYTFDFTDYSPKDLAQILNQIATSSGFKLDAELLEDEFAKLAELIEANTLPEARELMNGGICERIFTLAKQCLDARESSTVGTAPSVEILSSDIIEACKKIPPPPAKESAPPPAAPLSGRPPPTSTVGVTGKEFGRLLSRNTALEAEVARLTREVEASGSLRTDLARTAAELDSLRKASAGDAHATDVDAVAKAEGRAASAEAEVAHLKKMLAETRLPAAGGADLSSEKPPPPENYEVRPCLQYSCGCLFFFVMFCWFWTKIFTLWCWKWTVIFAKWCWRKIRAALEGEDKVATVVPTATTVSPAGTTAEPVATGP